MSRAERRGVGKRQAKRFAAASLSKALELHSQGLSVPAIAASTGLTTELVNDVIAAARKADEDG